MVTISQRSSVAGGNLCEFFALATNAFATKNSHIEDHTKSTKTTGHPNKKDLKINLDAQHGDSAFESFLTTYLTNVDYTAVSDTYEDGQVETATNASTDKMFGYILYFGSKGTTRKVLYGVGVISGDTGNYETGNKQFEKTPVEITGVPAFASLSIPLASFNTYIVSGAATVTLASGSYGVYTFMTAV